MLLLLLWLLLLLTQITARKAQWFEEHQMLRDQAVERALKVNNLEWQQKWDSELYKQIEEELNKGESC